MQLQNYFSIAVIFYGTDKQEVLQNYVFTQHFQHSEDVTQGHILSRIKWI